MLQPDLSTILAQWHQWRATYSPERKYSRIRFINRGDSDEEFEKARMERVEDIISALPRVTQIALQHVARTECLGVEVIHSNRLPDNPQAREAEITDALSRLHRALLRDGLL